MKPLLLLIIALAITPTAYSAEEKNYYCEGEDFSKDICETLEKGDLLYQIPIVTAAFYCDNDHPILKAETSKPKFNMNGIYNLYTCIYNGKEIKSFTKNKERK
jgi:hypothetical protein